MELLHQSGESEWLYYLLYSEPFINIYLGVALLSGMCLFGTLLITASRIGIEIDRRNFRLTWWLLGLCYGKLREKTENIHQVKLSRVGLPLKQNMIIGCVIRSRLRNYYFCSLLTQQEKEWIVGELRAFLAQWR